MIPATFSTKEIEGAFYPKSGVGKQIRAATISDGLSKTLAVFECSVVLTNSELTATHRTMSQAPLMAKLPSMPEQP